MALDAMGERGCEMVRKGATKDWENYMGVRWGEVDEVFVRELGGVGALAPLRLYMGGDG